MPCCTGTTLAGISIPNRTTDLSFGAITLALRTLGRLQVSALYQGYNWRMIQGLRSDLPRLTRRQKQAFAARKRYNQRFLALVGNVHRFRLFTQTLARSHRAAIA
ncbi:MAG: hypothetical protein MK312_08600 [Roseibacillus sp.]|nr:hypothetical protein [Roseibacillus sp.]